MSLVDFVIITALPEEFQAVKQALLPDELKTDDHGTQVWFRTTLENKTLSRKYHLVVAFQPKMGPFDAISLTKDSIDRWQPAYIIMTGIAGSFQEEVALGDVVISQQVFYYDMGKAVDNVDQKGQSMIKYRPQGYPCSVTLIRQAELIAVSDSNWQKKGQLAAKKMAGRLKAKTKTGASSKIKILQGHRSTVHFGTMASGSLVVASVRKKNELLRLHGKIMATEMEGAGVMHQAYYQEPTTPAIIIKGISDAADPGKAAMDKDGSWRKLALQNASNFVVEMIKQGRFPALNTDKFELSGEKGGPSPARELINMPVSNGEVVSFLSFPKLVIPHGPLTGITIAAVAFSEGRPLEIRYLAVRYTNSHERQTVMKKGSHIFHEQGYIGVDPIRVYLMIMGQADTLKFTVETFSMKDEIEIRIS